MSFTLTQVRMLRVLSDGRPHSKMELWHCLEDDLSAITAIKPHLTRIRKRLNPKGEDIVCVVNHRRNYYQHVRLLPSAHDGKH